MTEVEWLGCIIAREMLNSLGHAMSGRKARLYAVACARRVGKWMTDERSRTALDVSEEYADQRVGRKRLTAARRRAFAASKATEKAARVVPTYSAAYRAAVIALHATSDSRRTSHPALALSTTECANSLVSHVEGEASYKLEIAAQASLVRDVFGNPFRPLEFDASWRTRTAVSLAKGMYESRDFGAMPILADALQDAGCTSEDILDHCRGDGPHVRGCWVVDLVLGQE